MLKDELKGYSGVRREFLLYRITGIDSETTRKLLRVKLSTYRSWFKNKEFVALYRRLDELNVDYEHEALRLLRRINQRSAVVLERRMVAKMTREIATGKPFLIRTNLGTAIYNKLMGDVDYQPTTQIQTFDQRVQGILLQRSRESDAIEGEYHEQLEANNSPEEQYQASHFPQADEQASYEVEKKA